MPEEPTIPRDKVVRTMKTDLAEVVRERESSMLELAARGSDRRYQEGYVPPRRGYSINIRAFVIGFIALVVLGAGGGGAYYWYAAYKKGGNQIKELEIPRSILQTQQTQKITIKPGDRSSLIAELKKREIGSSGDFTYVPVVLTDFATDPNLATPEKFFSILKMDPPPDLLPSFTGRWNIYTHSGNLVLVFETKDWRATWGSMLAWERILGDDFSQILPQTPDPGMHNFSDAVIKNEDARIGSLSSNNASHLAYAVSLRQFLVITSSEEALRDTLELMVAGPINN